MTLWVLQTGTTILDKQFQPLEILRPIRPLVFIKLIQ